VRSEGSKKGTTYGARIGRKNHGGCLSILIGLRRRRCVSPSELKDDFAFPNHAELVPRDTLDGAGVAPKGLYLSRDVHELPPEPIVFLFDFRKLGFQGAVPGKTLGVQNSDGDGDNRYDENSKGKQPDQARGAFFRAIRRWRWRGDSRGHVAMVVK